MAARSPHGSPAGVSAFGAAASGYVESVDDIQGERALDTRIECPRCVAAGIVTSSGYATHVICMPDLHPPFRCLATHGALSEDELVAAGVDPRLLRKWIATARRETPASTARSVDRSLEALIRRKQSV